MQPMEEERRMMRKIPTETIAAKTSSVNMSDAGEEGGKTGSHQDSVGLKPPTRYPLSMPKTTDRKFYGRRHFSSSNSSEEGG